MMNNFRHFTKVTDFSKKEIEKIIDRAIEMKKNNYRSDLLRNSHICMLFEKPSTRTRISFEVAISSLGGIPIYLDQVTTQLTRGEPMKDFMRVLNSYVKGLVVRLYKHNDLDELIKYSTIPVINGLTDKEHPCQALSDMMTLKELGYLKKGNVLAFYGDANFNVANSLLVVSAMFGLKVRIVSPEKYASNEEYRTLIKKYGNLEIETDPIKGAEGVDIIYTDTWISMGIEHEKAERIRELLPYQVNDSVIKKANKNVIVMHCLPAYRNFEITDSIIEKYSNVIFLQSENKLHLHKALLEYIFSN
ncbi:MAG: ornithine carbamoyltransferase [Candidatus Micrarchaeota archaeon]|nr:ornithine carbamoyltransferase [Candidatus Micrarchaeota archaeon]